MSHIESTLKRFLLLSSISMVMTQPCFAFGSTAAISGNAGQTAERGQMVTVAKAKHHAAIRHGRSANDETFTYNFSVPILPAINQ